MWVKICGITSVDDALSAADAGADAIGLNFVPGSVRRVDEAGARVIADSVRGRLAVVGVVADLDAATLRKLRAGVGLDLLQLHGNESPGLLEAVLPAAYKALRIGSRTDVERAERYAGDRLLVDSRVEGMLGGSGKRLDWGLVAELSSRRRLILAGGLEPGNVATAIRAVRPWGVDAASGVERAPGKKDAKAVRCFVAAARLAARKDGPARDGGE